MLTLSTWICWSRSVGTECNVATSNAYLATSNAYLAHWIPMLISLISRMAKTCVILSTAFNLTSLVCRRGPCRTKTRTWDRPVEPLGNTVYIVWMLPPLSMASNTPQIKKFQLISPWLPATMGLLPCPSSFMNKKSHLPHSIYSGCPLRPWCP